MTAQPEFAKNWMVEVLKGPPMIAPARQYVYPVYVPGEEDAMARGALLLMVKPANAPAFLATCARGFAGEDAPSGVFACPNPDAMCAVAGGYAYMIDVTRPETCTQIPFRPVVEVRPLTEQGLLLFVGFHALLAWGAKGERWQTGKLTDEGLRITDVDGGAVHGFGWKMMTDTEVAFSVNLTDGGVH
ncbi:MAG: hypothetical protein P4L10_06365 [Acidobacteriaceae bacterium]|nr:hypothetical protein [Acidobacteriaceae bacterium]